jgi:hypothetical protein
MTDPNLPPERPSDRPEVVHHTTINNPSPERSGGGGSAMAFIIGGLVVVAIIIAFVVFSQGGGGLPDAKDTNVDIDVDLPQPTLPDPPKMPDLPNVEPPSVPSPAPAN